MASDICRIISTSFLCIVVLLLLGSQTSLAGKDCTDVECEPTINCIEEAIEGDACCPTCVQFGCMCEGYQYYDCVNVGFKDGKVPEGESYFVDFGSTECSCPAGGGRISCNFIPCPELPPNCIDILQPADGCVQCGRIGCIHGEEKYDAGNTFHMSLCKFCHCPNTGGEIMCYEIPDCDLELDSTTPLMDTPDSDPERQYDYPYSQEHDATELASPAAAEKNNNYKRNALQDHSLLDYDDGLGDSLNSSTLYPFNEVEFTTSSYQTIHPSVPKELNATSTVKAYRTEPTTTVALMTTSNYNESRLEKTTAQQNTLRPHIEPEEILKDSVKLSNVLPTESSTSSRGDLKTAFQSTPTPYTMSPMSRHASPEEKREETSTQLNSIPTVRPTPQQKENSQQMTTQSPTTLPLYIEERYDPSHIFNISRLHDGSTKDLVETCCAAGQQWSIDHGECENMPLSASEECSLAEKQCCISYIKENTCIAGMIAAKEDGICLPAENDMCERSYFKLCCDCCSWGLKVRKEGSSCESNLNLGYPCNHMMILCCNGDEQLILPDAKVPSKPELLVLPEADIDECVLNTHTCVQGERCVNTVGSFVCIQEERCETGFAVVNGVCTDIDECVMNKHTCATGERCVNTVGSFICIQERRCESGYTTVDGVCTDINECSALAPPCKQGFTCVNTLGSFVCQRKQLKCNKGYQSNENGTMCIDINECNLGTHNCSQEQTCFNLPGSHRCDCKMGYRYDLFRKACLDINECWIYPGRLCHHTCENTVGSYKCSCFAGFQLGQDGKHCEDVNECKNNPCNQECTNVYGSYQCYCKEGYKLADDGISCEDIDECVQNFGSLCVFACVNTPGSYQCACPDTGYTLTANGRTCKDIDECEVGTHNCSSSEECYNVQGSYKCLSYACPENYRKVSNTVCERISCFNYQECQNTPVRISYLRLNFPAGVVVPAQIFRIGPSPTYAGDTIVLDIKKGNEENYFSSRKFNPYTGIIYLQRPVKKAKDFLLDVEMKLFRQGVVTTFLSRIYVFITSPS